MVDRICVVLEALSIAVCLHRLYGKKFRFDIATVSLMTIEMIMMQAIDYFGWPKELSMLFYPIIAGYCVIEFGFDLKELIINNVLNAIIICILQIMVMVIFYVFEIQQMIVGFKLLISNCIILCVIVCVMPHLRIKKIADLLKDKERLLTASLIVCIAITIFCVFAFKKINIISFYGLFQRILFTTCILMMGFLILRLGKYKIRSKEIETELKMHKLYADSFDNLIDKIRLKQHEFDNHINTIYSQHYIYDTYDKLVEAQKNYCQLVISENRFNKLLISGNPVIIGFLYGKFIEIDRMGIDISYCVDIKELKTGVPVYKLVEILGNLIGNAVDFLVLSKVYNNLFVRIVENEEDFTIEVRNESNYFNYTEIELFFVKGYSKKGKNRGMGLFHVKNICDEYKLDLSCRNIEIEGKNWIEFTILGKKRNH